MEENPELIDTILAGSTARGKPLTNAEIHAVNGVLRRLSYRLRHMQPQQEEGKLICWSPTYFLCRDIGTVREILCMMLEDITEIQQAGTDL